MSKLDYQKIRERIENEIGDLRPSEWAKKIGVKPNVVTNIHGKIQQNPSLGYIVSVSLATGRSVDYYLFGEEPQVVSFKAAANGDTPRNNDDEVVREHIEVVRQFEDKQTAKEMNINLRTIETLDKAEFKDVAGYLRGVANMLKKSKQVGRRVGKVVNGNE